MYDNNDECPSGDRPAQPLYNSSLFAGIGKAITKTVAVVELTKSKFAEKYAPNSLIQCYGSLNSITVDDHDVPRIQITLKKSSKK